MSIRDKIKKMGKKNNLYILLGVTSILLGATAKIISNKNKNK